MLVYPTRLRSHSSPSRPRAAAADASDPPAESSAQASSSSPAAHGVENVRRPHAKSSSSAISPRPHSGKRKILRLKRPSSSSSALQDSREFSSFQPDSPAPPRPPRNPARVNRERERTFAFASVADPTQFPIVAVATPPQPPPTRPLDKQPSDHPSSWIFPRSVRGCTVQWQMSGLTCRCPVPGLERYRNRPAAKEKQEQ